MSFSGIVPGRHLSLFFLENEIFHFLQRPSGADFSNIKVEHPNHHFLTPGERIPSHMHTLVGAGMNAYFLTAFTHAISMIKKEKEI